MGKTRREEAPEKMTEESASERPSELPPPPPGGVGAATTAFDQFQAIIEISHKSQEVRNRRVKEVGDARAVTEPQPHQSMWEEYAKRFPQPFELRQADFSGLLFAHARFRHHAFIGCDFSRSRWVLSSIEDSNCTRSSFAGIATFLSPFRNTDCTSCDFTNARITFFEPFVMNHFENANFTNARVVAAHSYFSEVKLDSRARFDDAIMNGCTLTIERVKQPQYNKSTEELRSILERIFSPEQLGVMRIDYQAKPVG